eukprot:TRINITY_DN2101_c0_g1_i2.p1 TRINITY_DN2101_c0_g1~~TRINITY_DN2101_c0_g1_i2.p1  ORF type:complete len:1043 (-),score=243.04 TRINITY_DN2101_c0_g1_i2:933-3743(-)
MAVAWCPSAPLLAALSSNRAVSLLQEGDLVVVTKHTLEDCQPDGRAGVCWRGDGAFFAVSFAAPSLGGAVRVCVFDVSGVMTATCAATQSVVLGPHVTWKPSGSLITVSGGGGGACRLHVFERVGAYKCTLDLNHSSPNYEVSGVAWNSSSDVLAVALSSTTKSAVLQLWSHSNDHWYLKQQLLFACNTLAALEWDPEDAAILRVLTNSGQLYEYRFVWEFSVSDDESSTVAVIDGCKLLLTPLARSIVPPPLAARTVALPLPAVHASLRGGALLAQMHEQPSRERFALYRHRQCAERRSAAADSVAPPTTRTWPEPELMAHASVSLSELHSSALRLCCLVSETSFVAVAQADTAGRDDELVEFCVPTPGIPKDESEVIVLSPVARLSCPGKVMAIAVGAQVYLELESGAALVYDKGSLTREPAQDLPVGCPWIKVAQINGKDHLVGLSPTCALHIAGLAQPLCAGCTSFGLHSTCFLLYTTLDVTLNVVPLTAALFKEEDYVLKLKQRWRDHTRNIERGGVIAAIPNVADSTLVILEMPRGNLETVHPRALVVHAVTNFLKVGDYAKAMACVRRHRIDPNLLCDYDLPRFLRDVPLVLRQVPCPDHINFLLASLREGDVTSAAYLDPAAPARRTPAKGAKKVNVVCDAFRQALVAAGERKYATCIVTSYIAKLPQELEQVLLLIRRLHEEEKQGGDIDECDATAEKLLEFAAVFVDINTLFNTALSMYDFDLVLMVAEKSQRDPREYLAFVEELRGLQPPEYQRYAVDMHLKHYSSALEHLSKAGDEKFPEYLDVVRKQDLFSYVTLSHYHDRPHLLRQLCDAYAAHLQEKGDSRQAGLLHLRAENYTAAVACFTAASEWRNALTSAYRAKYGPDQRKKLALDLAEQLQAGMQFTDAAAVLEAECGDSEAERILGLYLTAHAWEDAVLFVRTSRV